MIVVDEKALETISRSFVVPPRPEILAQLKDTMEQEEPSLLDVADIISKDIAISAAILKLINSPIFGLARSVSDIRQAAMFIGLDGLYSLVQALKLKEAFVSENSVVDLTQFWDEAEEIAKTALFIGGRLKSEIPGENLYTLGLFHDCGIPMLATKYDNYGDVLAKAANNYDKSLAQLEDRVYETNHAILGYYIASSWFLPKDICQIILRHHDKDVLTKLDGSEEQLSFAVLKMAENLVHEERKFAPSTEWHFLRSSVLEVLGFTDYDYVDIKEELADTVF
ncbi:MAG: HDOD domain-containing protein [Gammaproteobacteria bacterium]|nr:HDOD domain-containing protein [Gammaproteobacteria bacterium]